MLFVMIELLKERSIIKASTRSKQAVYFTTPDFIVGSTPSEIGVKDELPIRSVAYSLVQSNQTPTALKLLNAIGDKYYMRKLYNTFTNDEYALIENELSKSVFDTRKRYKEGKIANYLPDPNAFCVLDALRILTEDTNAKIHLNDPEFQYNAISRKTQQTDGSKLVYPEDIVASTNSIKYNETRLNASLSVNYRASVPLNPDEFSLMSEEDLTKYGFEKGDKYYVTCYRTYNIILDGKLNTKKLILSDLSRESKNKLSELLTLREDSRYVLDLSSIPLINKSYLNTTSAKSLALDCWRAHAYSAELSVLKYLSNRYAAEKSELDDFSESKAQFLSEKCYITRGSYQPPKIQAESTDKYSAYEFSVSFKGFSKASASSVIKKIESGKSVTTRESLIEYFYNKYSSSSIEKLAEYIKEVSQKSAMLGAKIQSSKLAIILINRGAMDEFSNRSDMSIEIPADGYMLEFDTPSVTAEFKITRVEVLI